MDTGERSFTATAVFLVLDLSLSGQRYKMGGIQNLLLIHGRCACLCVNSGVQSWDSNYGCRQ